MKRLLFIIFSIVIFLPVEGQYLLRDNPDFNISAAVLSAVGSAVGGACGYMGVGCIFGK